MEWIIVVSLILFGTLLLMAEIVFIPGVFVAGLIGVGLTVVGIVQSYGYFGTTVGNMVLVGAFVTNVIGLMIVFRGKSWEKFALKQTMEGKVNEELQNQFKIGDKGVTLSVLRPVGKALFNDKEVEVSSRGGIIEENEAIEIIELESTKIIVIKSN